MPTEVQTPKITPGLFNLGKTTITPATGDLFLDMAIVFCANENLPLDEYTIAYVASKFTHHFLGKHVVLDDGDLCEEDKQTNQIALQHGGRIFSSYQINKEEKLWIITESQNKNCVCEQGSDNLTTILCPDDY